MFQIGSVTKVFTTTLLMVLRDEGKVGLDDPVAKYLPESVQAPYWQKGEERVVPTLHQLATHTAGFPPNPPNRRNRPKSPSVMEPYSIADLYEGLAETKLVFEPGTSWQYSNYGVVLLGHALERAAGRPYEVLLREKILEPLGPTPGSRSRPRIYNDSPRTIGPTRSASNASAGSSASSARSAGSPRPRPIWRVSP